MSRYLVAVAAALAALLVRWLLDSWLANHLPFITIYGAVAAAVWFGGHRPALLATALGYLGCNYFFMEPRGTIALAETYQLIGLISYLVTCSLIIGFGESTRIALRRAEVSRRDSLARQKKLEREVKVREQAAKELRRAEEQTRSVVENVLDGIVTIDAQGIVQSFNPAAERLFGYPASEVIGQNVKSLMPEPYSFGHDTYLANYLQTGEAKIIGIGREVAGRRKDGSTFPMDLAVSEFRLGEGRYFTGIVRDITERKRNEDEVRRLNQELQNRLDEWTTVLNMIPVGVGIAHDPQCRRITHNPYISKLLGVQAWENASLSVPADERTASYAVQRDGKDLSPDQMPMQLACTGVDVQDFECDLVRKGQPPIRLICSARPLRDAEGRIRGSVGTSLDITPRREFEDALKDADRHKDEFLATLSHELRNPLAPLRNALELVRQGSSDPVLIERARKIMERQVGQMIRLVDDLLDVSRISHGKMELRKKRIELSETLRDAVETSRPLIDSFGHELTLCLPQAPIYLNADPVRLAQVFSNLLNNAASYTKAGGNIQLAAEQQGNQVVVSVKDNGIGITSEALPHIFEMFSQATPVLERSHGGLGIGLSLVKGVVDLHGGGIEARSDGLEKGSEFVVRLPVLVEKQEEPVKREGDFDEPLHLAKRRILVADDLKDSTDSLAMLLRMSNHEVHTAYDGEEAVAAAEQFRPEAILLDIGMPKLNGYDACRRIREQPWAKDVLLIAVTGWGQDEDRRRTLEAGFNVHLVKPVKTRDLMQVLAQLSTTPH